MKNIWDKKKIWVFIEILGQKKIRSKKIRDKKNVGPEIFLCKIKYLVQKKLAKKNVWSKNCDFKKIRLQKNCWSKINISEKNVSGRLDCG